MNGDELRADLEADFETELSRLGSSKTIYAATEGAMDADAVLQSMADRAHAAAVTFDEWAADTTDAVLADVYGSMAAAQHDHVDRIVAAGTTGGRDRPTGLQQRLRALDRPVDRAGGMLAWALVVDETYSQVVGFFVGNAAPASADRFRDLRSEIEADRERIEELLGETCETERDWERAYERAAGAIEAAYEDYVETLEELGVKVKPVC